VLFRLPKDMSRDDAMSKYRASIPIWQGKPDLIRKTFLYDEASQRGGAVYLWDNIESANKLTARHFRSASGRPSEPTPSSNILKRQ
jgi:hypothetical protein